jgi:hypothetical protein
MKICGNLLRRSIGNFGNDLCGFVDFLEIVLWMMGIF